MACAIPLLAAAAALGAIAPAASAGGCSGSALVSVGDACVEQPPDACVWDPTGHVGACSVNNLRCDASLESVGDEVRAASSGAVRGCRERPPADCDPEPRASVLTLYMCNLP